MHGRCVCGDRGDEDGDGAEGGGERMVSSAVM